MRCLLGIATALVIACATVSRGAEPLRETSPLTRPRTLASTAPPKRVLLLFGEDQRFPMINALSQSIRSNLNSKSTIRIEYHTEYLDRSLIGDAVYEDHLVSLWRKKYDGRRIDLIFVSLASALDLLSRHGAELFPNAPTVFCVLLQSQLSTLSELGPNVTGVGAASPFRPNLELALRLHPGTQRVIVVYGSADSDLLSITKSELREFESEVEIIYLTDLTISEYQERLASLPEHTIVLFGNLTRDREGYIFTTLESLSRIAPSSAAPIYGLTDVQLGSGIVGGNLISFDLMGATAAEIGTRILAGEKPHDIPPQIVPNVLMFDWRELKRWGISEESLPPGSMVEFHVPSFWDDYKWYAIGLLSVVIFQSVLIAGLVINRTRRKRVEDALRESEDRYRDLVENSLNLICTHDLTGNLLSVNQAAADTLGFRVKELIGNNIREMLVPEFRDQFDDYLARIRRDGIARGTMAVRTRSGERRVWEYVNTLRTEGVDAPIVRGVAHDITERKRAEEALRETEERFRQMADGLPEVIWITSLDPESVLYVSPSFESIWGLPAEDLYRNPRLWIETIHQEDRDRVASVFARWICGEDVSYHNVEFRIVQPNGNIRWIHERGMTYLDKQGKPYRVSGISTDITEQKQAQEALRESEERFRNMADTAPVLIWVAGHNKLCTYFNQQWLNFTGRTLEEELGNGWLEGVHPEDYECCVETYTKAFDLCQPFTMEYRLRRADGQFRWILDSGTARFSSGGKFLGYIGSCIDITERKAAEEALEDLSGQLIRARENECARIARELHDDLNQRMALISIELEQLGLSAPDSDGTLQMQLRGIIKQAAEVSREIHRISYDLHPSKLIQLGLVAAVKSLCDELRSSHELKIEFFHEGAPASLPQDISLCLYRIVQESLNNVLRHSGAKEAEVELRWIKNQVRLSVSDSGIGFDIESPRIRKGLGLLGMRERLRLVGGQISIRSRAPHGTQIDVRVPLGRTGVDAEASSPTRKRRAAQI